MAGTAVSSPASEQAGPHHSHRGHPFARGGFRPRKCTSVHHPSPEWQSPVPPGSGDQTSFQALGSFMLPHTHHKKERKKVKSLSRVRLSATPWTVAHQASPSMEFSMHEYWSGLPFPSSGDLPDSGIEPRSPALQADALPSEPPGNLPAKLCTVLHQAS